MSQDHPSPPAPARPDGVAFAVRQRLERAVKQLEEQLSRQDQLRVLSASDDLGVLIQAVLARSASTAPAYDEPLLQARLRGVAAKQELAREEGGCVPVAALQILLNKSRQAIEKQREAGRLFAVDFASPRAWHYPQWQFEGAAPLGGMAEVLAVLPRDDPWAVMIFFLRTDIGDGRTPLHALRAGSLDDVLRAARVFGTQGAA